MNPIPYQFGAPPPWFPSLPPNPPASSAFWENRNVNDRLKDLQDTLNLAKAMQKELEMLMMFKEGKGLVEDVDNGSDGASVSGFSKYLKDRGISGKFQESHSVEAANALMSMLRSQLEPFMVISDESCPWEEKSYAFGLLNKVKKYKRNKFWRKRKRKRVAEMLAKEREQFDKVDQEADEWRARELAKDIAKRKMEKMKEVAQLKAKEEKRKLESELELVLVVEKLQELRSMRIQKLKKQGHFFPEEDDKFIEKVRAAVEEEERQAISASGADAAKDAIATAEESRKTILNRDPDTNELNSDKDVYLEINDEITKNESNKASDTVAADKESGKQIIEGQGNKGAYDHVTNLPIEFYHYYHGSNTDMGTLIEVRRTWDAYIRPGGSRIPGHWVQPPPPADEMWASYLVRPKEFLH